MFWRQPRLTAWSKSGLYLKKGLMKIWWMGMSMLLYEAIVRRHCSPDGTQWPISRWLLLEWTVRLKRGMCRESVLFRVEHSRLSLGLWSGTKMGNFLGRLPRTSACISWTQGRKGKLRRSQHNTKALALKGCSGLEILARSLPLAQVPEMMDDNTPSLTLAISAKDQSLRIDSTITLVTFIYILNQPITSCLWKVAGTPAVSTSS